jgi:hypothetical protein
MWQELFKGNLREHYIILVLYELHTRDGTIVPQEKDVGKVSMPTVHFHGVLHSVQVVCCMDYTTLRRKNPCPINKQMAIDTLAHWWFVC